MDVVGQRAGSELGRKADYGGREWWSRCDFLGIHFVSFSACSFQPFSQHFDGVLSGQLTIESFCIQGVWGTESKSGIIDFRWQRIGNVTITGFFSALLDFLAVFYLLAVFSLLFHIFFIFLSHYCFISTWTNPLFLWRLLDHIRTTVAGWLTEKACTTTGHLSDFVCTSQMNDLLRSPPCTSFPTF